MTQRAACAGTVLVVDDDRLILEAMRDALELDGYTVEMATNGEEALAFLARSPAPCLVLLDLFMPVMNGWQFLEQIRGRPGTAVAAVPIVVVSAAGEVASEAARVADGYLRKPVDLDLLLTTVESYCATAGGPQAG